jgi:hypothetical protein
MLVSMNLKFARASVVKLRNSSNTDGGGNGNLSSRNSKSGGSNGNLVHGVCYFVEEIQFF